MQWGQGTQMHGCKNQLVFAQVPKSTHVEWLDRFFNSIISHMPPRLGLTSQEIPTQVFVQVIPTQVFVQVTWVKQFLWWDPSRFDETRTPPCHLFIYRHLQYPPGFSAWSGQRPSCQWCPPGTHPGWCGTCCRSSHSGPGQWRSPCTPLWRCSESAWCDPQRSSPGQHRFIDVRNSQTMSAFPFSHLNHYYSSKCYSCHNDSHAVCDNDSYRKVSFFFYHFQCHLHLFYNAFFNNRFIA